jgi:signal transduction histidine kinase
MMVSGAMGLGLIGAGVLAGVLYEKMSACGQQRAQDVIDSEIFYDAIDQANRGLIFVSEDMKVLFVNSWLAPLLKCAPGKQNRRPLHELFPFSATHPVLTALQEHLKHSPPHEESSLFKANLFHGTKEPEHLLIAAFRSLRSTSSGERFYLLSFADISSAENFQNKLENALKEAESNVKKMTEVDRLKSEFLAICSHELKTPLVSISGYLDLLRSGKLGPLTPKQENAIAISLRNTSRLNSLISSLLEFARMEAGKLRFEFSPQRVGSLLEEVIGVVQPMADAKPVKILLALPPEPIYALADNGLLHRAILNLLDNAIKFTPAQGNITVTAQLLPDNMIAVTIEDSGVGIPVEKLSHVKEPFFQGDASDTRKAGGLGLGLAIVEKILVGHSSSLQIRSTPDHGTCVGFTLRAAKKTGSGKFAAVVSKP